MINLFHLRYFMDAARAKSVSAAARKNRVSQSAVSQALRSLEATLGVTLTSHEKKSFHLTEEGRRVVDLSNAVFASVEAMQAALNEAKTEYAGEIVIGCTNSIASHFVTRELGRICADHPRLRPRLRIGNSDTLSQWLSADQIDLALMIDSAALPKGVTAQKMHSGKYVLFRSAASAGKTSLERLVVTRAEREEVLHVLKFSKLFKRDHNGRAEIFCELTSWETIRAFVRETPGCVGLCPDYVIRSDVREGHLRILKTAFEMPAYELVLAQRGTIGRNASLIAERLLAQKAP